MRESGWNRVLSFARPSVGVGVFYFCKARPALRAKTKEFSMPNSHMQERYQDTQLYRIRHSAAHIMAQAVLEFYPETKFTIGPPVENGFYYDFELPQPIQLEDLEKIEKRMRQIIAGNHKFEKKVVSAEEAREVFKDQPYKL